LSSYVDIVVISPYVDTMPTRITSLRLLSAAVRGRRLELGLSQAELAERAHVSRQWVNEFEAGKPSAELGLVLRLLDALDLELTVAERSADAGTFLDALLDDHGEP
jgi:HTH-type transcriptional regulator/antitoxin HipB